MLVFGSVLCLPYKCCHWAALGGSSQLVSIVRTTPFICHEWPFGRDLLTIVADYLVGGFNPSEKY